MSVISRHNAGFFSCCSVKLEDIVDYIRKTQQLPTYVDSSEQFVWYKPPVSSDDITYEYFEHYDNIEIAGNYLSIMSFFANLKFHSHYQFTDYSTINYNSVCQVLKKYFSPSINIRNIIKKIEDKYNLEYENICVLFYRGNDKITETKLCTYDEYLIYANSIIANNPNIKFLIQSDETGFIEFMRDKFPNNSFYFKDEIRHISKCNSTVDLVMPYTNYEFSKYYLAITIIMSKCKFIVCGSGNCSLWIMLYRGNNNNVYQNLNGKWLNV